MGGFWNVVRDKFLVYKAEALSEYNSGLFLDSYLILV